VKELFSTLLKDASSRSWRGGLVAFIVSTWSLWLYFAPNKWLGGPFIVITIIALIMLVLTIKSDPRRSMRSDRGSVYGMIILTSLTWTAAVESVVRLQKGGQIFSWQVERAADNTLTGFYFQFSPIVLVGGIVLLSLLSMYLEYKISQKQKPIKGMKSSKLFQ
jgi:hypothetical protein